MGAACGNFGWNTRIKRARVILVRKKAAKPPPASAPQPPRKIRPAPAPITVRKEPVRKPPVPKPGGNRFEVSPIERGGFDVARGPVFTPGIIEQAQGVPQRPGKKEPLNMSIWSQLGGAIMKGATKGITQQVQSKIAPAAILPAAAGMAGRVLPSIGRVLGSRTVAAGATGLAIGGMLGDATGNGCPSGFHPNKQDGARGPARTYCVRNRRMNFGNGRAARRSVRRLKGARKLLRDIEKMMPTKTRTRRPQHHHHPAAGG